MWECPHQHFAQHTEICPRASGAARLRALLHVPGVVVRGGSHGRRRIGELCCLRLCPGVAHRPTGLRVCHSLLFSVCSRGGVCDSGSVPITIAHLRRSSQCYHIGGFPQGDGSGLRHRWRHPGNNRNVRPGVLCPPQLHTHHSPSGPVLRRQLALPALPSSLTVISVKAVSGMIAESIKGQLQLIYPIFYVMLVVMVASCAFQIKFLNQAMKMFDATEVVPINFVFFTASAIVAGIVFYQEFEGLALLNIFMFLFGCLLSFLGVFLIARNRPKIKEQDRNFIAMDVIPGRRHTDKVQPEATATTYGSLAAKLMCHRAGQTDDS
ncbi:uncharacterized protein LOC118302540 isoform X3 [Scophthalmus maximus]|uniref:uncharacterized protein LOC118302540 isoform X3 n=1 Tax=Scophthalmus maximus TaxID=52904 RepID=UPI001FA84D81|nr:uncharacterized protein LOC118302540 isoform X3 [Scophthalmus maximus]XP_047187807.1 uncharacterized protein LOC118302540 isoform X3 [Scophthalmus maximus]XP_047187812.1 uncharacterized protein LOC118302540 isoform X3 [Scophthalmus maximus]